MIDDQSDPGSWREALRFREHMYTGAACITDAPEEPYTFNIDSELADAIVHQWVLRHLGYAEKEITAGDLLHEDWIEAEKDVKMFKRFLWYMTGEEFK